MCSGGTSSEPAQFSNLSADATSDEDCLTEGERSTTDAKVVQGLLLGWRHLSDTRSAPRSRCRSWPGSDDVAKYVWVNYQDELQGAGQLFYTWQHEVLWALDDLRREGRLLPKPKGHKGPWRLAG